MTDVTCCVPGCMRVEVSYRRCYRHRPMMTADELAAAKADVRSRRSAAKIGPGNPQYGKTEEQNRNWTGEQVGYFGVHDWMTSRFGQPNHCEECGTIDPAKRYEWANISGEYRRERSDFRRLCKCCHNSQDGVNILQQSGADKPQKFRAMRAIKGAPVSSRYKGVRASGHVPWRATVMIKGKITNLGSFPTEESAAHAYNEAVREAYGEDAYLNEIT